MTTQEFENKYHYKIVKPLGKFYPSIPIKEYIVTSALYNYEDDGTTTVFAIKSLDYTLQNKHWFTIKIASQEFEQCISDFIILRDGYEECVKPVILSEYIQTWVNIGPDRWMLNAQSARDGITKSLEINSKELPPGIPDHCQIYKRTYNSVLEYCRTYEFVYRSVFDLDRPSVYIVNLPPPLDLLIEEFIKPFRADVLNNQVAYGMNRRLLNT